MGFAFFKLKNKFMNYEKKNLKDMLQKTEPLFVVVKNNDWKKDDLQCKDVVLTKWKKG